MLIVQSADELCAILDEKRSQGKTVGFVPTMGYLHDGHMSLVENAKSTCDYVVVSIFVNPIQFGEGEDLKDYPRDLTRDQKLCEGYGVDLLFFPSKYEMYPNGDPPRIEYPEIMQKLCGVFRPGHFEGVATVMNRFFSIVGKCKCFMGKKDAQQLVVVKKLAREHYPDTEVIGCPLVREESGLALSSRNYYLSPAAKDTAAMIFQSLNKFVKSLRPGCNIEEELYTCKVFLSSLDFDVQYFSFVDARTIEDVKDFVPGHYLLAVAAKIQSTRLIDNFGVEVNQDMSIKVDRGVYKNHKEVQE